MLIMILPMYLLYNLQWRQSATLRKCKLSFFFNAKINTDSIFSQPPRMFDKCLKRADDKKKKKMFKHKHCRKDEEELALHGENKWVS